MKGSNKNTSGGIKLALFCFIAFLLLVALRSVVRTEFSVVGDIYLYASTFSYVLQIVLGLVGTVSFIVYYIKNKRMSWSIICSAVLMLAAVALAGYSAMPYISDFTTKPKSVTTSDYSVIGKEDEKTLYFSDNKNEEEALRLDAETLKYLEDNNSVDTYNSYVNDTSYLHHVNSITITYYPNTEILKEIIVSK